ncbi:hypothetical protein [Nocardia brasiliensis]|uniref:hypothetical protein n=1 Tax=Nocardia brasiliensis TaxID=37326 RepID=UPI0024557710|nr:hypothetical protein [Nocardia brasiliensis]
MPTENWLAERSRKFALLRGKRVESWAGVEMAFREDVAGIGPQFEDPEVPCLQLWGLLASLDDGSTFTVSSYQDGVNFGLCSDQKHTHEKLQDEGLWDGIYRLRRLTELPTGRVDQVTVYVDAVDSVLAEVHLQIGQRPILLVAGELDETWGGELVFSRLDESVLVFNDLAAVEQTPWSTSRQGLAPSHC